MGSGELLSTLDEDFPLGGGVAETIACVTCPYCAADVEITLDPGGGSIQRYVEDCEVCCRPWHLTVTWDLEGAARVEARTDDA